MTTFYTQNGVLLSVRLRRCGDVAIPDSVTLIDIRAFAYCGNLTNVSIPSSVTSIGPQVFFSCTALRSLSIPEEVTSIGDQAFGFCRSLKTCKLPSAVTSIGFAVFRSCSRLATLEMSSCVTSIGAEAFYGCRRLHTLEIPRSVVLIGRAAFLNCFGLTSIKMLSSTALIGVRAFYGCRNVQEVVVDKSTVNTPDSNGLTLLDRVIRSEAPDNFIQAMMRSGARFTDAGLAQIDAALVDRIRSWSIAIKKHQRAALYAQAFEIFCAHQRERAGFAPPNISRLPIEMWYKILYLDSRSHPDFLWLGKAELLDITNQALDDASTRLQRSIAERHERSVKQSVLYGYQNHTLRCLVQLGQQQADEARLHDWKQSGGSTAIVSCVYKV